MTRVRWGILGCANIARRAFLPALKASRNGSAQAIASRDGARASAWAAEHGIARAYDSYDALLKDAEVDAVYIPLPNGLHNEWVHKAARAGKHLFCEKPLTADALEAVKAVAVCARYDVRLFEAFVYRLQPQTALVRRLIAEGKIGRVRSANARFHFYLQERIQNVRMHADLAGGALMDVGCYCIDWGRWLFGEPHSVMARGTFERDLDTTCQGVLEFDEGRTVTFSSSFDMQGGQRAYIYGDEGEIELTLPWHPQGERAAVIVRAGGTEEVHRITPDVPPFTPAIEAFGDAVLAGRPFSVAPDEGLKNMRVIDAVRTSMRTGKRATVR